MKKFVASIASKFFSTIASSSVNVASYYWCHRGEVPEELLK